MDDYRLLIDLYKSANRQGPGGDAESEKALSLALIDRTAPLKIADIGCGTGRHSIQLAKHGYMMTGVDISSGMLAEAEAAAKRLDLWRGGEGCHHTARRLSE